MLGFDSSNLKIPEFLVDLLKETIDLWVFIFYNINYGLFHLLFFKSRFGCDSIPVDKIEAKLKKLKTNHPTMSKDLQFKIVQLNIKLMNSKNKSKNINSNFNDDEIQKMELFDLNEKLAKLEDVNLKYQKSNDLIKKDLDHLESLNKKLMAQNWLFVEKFQKLKAETQQLNSLEVSW